MKWVGVFVLLVCCVLNQACSPRNEKNDGSFRIILEDDQEALKQSQAKQAFGAISSFFAPSAPVSSADFSCFVVNVTGPGVGLDSAVQGCSSTTNFRGRGQGVFSRPRQRGSAIEVSVPSGPSRVVDVYGVYPLPRECGGSSGSGDNSKGYFLGSKVVNIAQDTSVTIPIAYSGSAGEITCDEGNSSGPNATTFFAYPDGVTGIVRANPINGGACTIAAANLLSEVAHSNAFDIPSPDRDPALNSNGSYLTRSCDNNAGNDILSMHYLFYLNPAQAPNYSSIDFTWKGYAGIKSSSCTSLVSAGSAATDALKLMVYNQTTNLWESLGTIGTTDATINASISNPATYVMTSGPASGSILVRASGGRTISGTECSVIYTDYVEAKFNP